MPAAFSRRDFLKLSALAAGGTALRPFFHLPLPEEDRISPLGLGRVTAGRVTIRRAPSLRAEKLTWRPKDHLFQLWDEVVSPDGPAHNPRWYRVVGGYIHSGYVQRVENRLNPPLTDIRPAGQLVEVTVPFTQTWRRTGDGRWAKLYRLYYGSVHWATDLIEGPDGQPWYNIMDDLLRIPYAAPAAHLRPIPDAELAPLSPEVPADEKHIQISLSEQKLTAYEFNRPVFTATVATGLPQEVVPEGEISTETPTGHFVIDHKRPIRHMGNGEITSDPLAYELPGVPWVSYFVSLTGIAIHGTYWHDNFGQPMSRGCVNMRNEDAKWLFRWTAPVYEPPDWYKIERGTLVRVLE